MQRFNVVIVGTGASAVAAAAPYVNSGIEVTFIDAGSAYEGGAITPELVKPLKNKNSNQHEQITNSSPGSKSWFGTYYPYENQLFDDVVYDSSILVRPSQFIGGYTRIWGATFDFPDISKSWPKECIPNSVDYEAIKSMIPHSKTIHGQNSGGLVGNSVTSKLFNKISKFNTNWKVVTSTLAINSESTSRSRCILCSECLEGCKPDSIWFAGNQINDWISSKKVKLLPNHLVTHYVDNKSDVLIKGKTAGGGTFAFKAKRLFLATGAVSTAIIVLRSHKNLKSVEIRDTATTFSAGINFNWTRQNVRASHALSQFWMFYFGSKDFAAQIYPPVESNEKRLLDRFPIFSKFPGVLRVLNKRIIPIICYSDQDFSDSVVVEYKGNDICVGSINEKLLKNRKAQLRKMSAFFLKAGVFVPWFLSDYSPAGTGYHFGSSLPHGINTDSLGRLKDENLVHIVDSTVLPSLKVGSITPLVMANSHRISRETLKL